jgi:hypothetical protein
MPRNTDKSDFESLTFDTRKDFHSPESQRLRNADRREGRVYDVGLNYVPSENSEGINESIVDTQGNDELQFDSSETGSGAGGGGGGIGNDTLETEYVDSSNTAQQATFVIVT